MCQCQGFYKETDVILFLGGWRTNDLRRHSTAVPLLSAVVGAWNKATDASLCNSGLV